MKLPTVAELRQHGWKVGVKHTRPHPAFGGYTQVFITPPGEEASFNGWAACNPKDNWNRRLGLTIALGRALKAYGWKRQP